MEAFKIDCRINDSLLREQIAQIYDGPVTITGGKVVLPEASLGSGDKEQIYAIFSDHDYTQKSKAELKREQYEADRQEAVSEAGIAKTDGERVAVLWKYFAKELGV